jgi:pimeloyl-ACP methyl ester carboxylesterase
VKRIPGLKYDNQFQGYLKAGLSVPGFFFTLEEIVSIRLVIIYAVLLPVLLLTGCFATAKAPLEILKYETTPERNKNLIVFLRGMGGTLNCIFDGHECFEKVGFVEAVWMRGLPYDMIAPNAHFGYYNDRSLMARLKEDVILPAKAMNYEKIWLVGTSMGGLGSIMYLKEHTKDIDGVLLLGPFLGERSLIEEIYSAGGIDQWEPGDYDEQEDWQRMIWHWLKDYSQDGSIRPPIYLGIGKEDHFYRDQKLLASSLPPERVIEVSGKHRFSTFKRVWDIFLERQILK